MISDAAIAYLKLSLAHGVGSLLAQRIAEQVGSITELWRMSPAQWQSLHGVGHRLAQALAQVDEQRLQQVLGQCRQAGFHLLCPEDDLYPAILKQIEDMPCCLFVQGNVDALRAEKLLGFVGARRASREGQLIARRWAKSASNQGAVVVSGMAYGIDAAAHGGALEGASPTIAVLGCGLGSIHSDLQRRQVAAIAKHGCVLTEYLPDEGARPEHFPKRNRIIAGMTQGVVVIEAGLKSGSLITARLAAEYGREVMAVPGSVLASAHQGCHHLIRDGAVLVESMHDIWQCLGWEMAGSGAACPEPAFASSDAYDMRSSVLQALRREALHVDALADVCGLTLQALSPMVLALELEGAIERLPGNRYIIGGKSE